MWWTGQNLDGPIYDKGGNPWYFRVWHDILDGNEYQKIFFWNEDRSQTGVLELTNDQVLHVRKIKQRMAKLAKDPTYRSRFLKPLEFPIERFYSD